MVALPLTSTCLFFFPLLILHILIIFFFSKNPSSWYSSTSPVTIPKVHPFAGSLFAVYSNWNRRVQWISDLIRISPTATFVLHRWFGKRQVFTGNLAVVQHILKTHFHVYPKGNTSRTALWDFIGDGIFSAEGDAWKIQRQVSSHELNTNSLRKFKPDWWLRWEEAAKGRAGKWKFVGRDNYTCPVVQAGPRICLGKEMAFFQMKRLVAEIVRQFRVVPVAGAGEEPEFVQHLTAKMTGGFLVRIEETQESK